MNVHYGGLTVSGRERALTAGTVAGFSFAACMVAAACWLAAMAVRVARTTKEPTP